MDPNFDSIPIISHDDTIMEVYDKKWKKYLIPRINILKAKYGIIKTPTENKMISIPDKDGNLQSILETVVYAQDEDNLTYQWLEVVDVNNQTILVKKEHLYQMKITNEETMIMDYYGKKKQIISGKVCRKAKKYHSTEGKTSEKILFKVKDEKDEIHFVTKPIIKFAKKKRMLNDEISSTEITDKEGNIINVPLENIRDINDLSAYSEYCEISDIGGTKIIVKKTDLQDLKELADKNLIQENNPMEINDYTLKSIFKIRPNEQYLNLFPNKYSYCPDNKEEEFLEIKDINDQNVMVKRSLIEYYLNENLNDLGLEEEVNDINLNRVVINPYKIVKEIIMNYDDIICKPCYYIELPTQSGTKHLIRRHTITKALKLFQNSNDYVNIKDSNSIKIVTTFQKLKEIDINSSEILLVPLEDINGKIAYIKKRLVMDIVNKIVGEESVEECESVKDYLGNPRVINVRQINVKNSSLKKNY